MSKFLCLPTLSVTLASLFAVNTLSAQTEAPAAAPTEAPAAPSVPGEAPAAAEAPSVFKSVEEKQSYAMGLNLAAQLKRNTEDLKKLNLDEVVQGMHSIQNGTQSDDFLKGVNFGLIMRQNGLKFDEKTLLMAIKDSLDGQASKLTDSETRTQLMSIQNAMQQGNSDRLKAIGAKNLAEATAFLEKNGKEPGVVTTRSGLQYKVLKDAPQGGKLKAEDIAEVIMGTYEMDGTRTDKGMDGKARKIGQNFNKGIGELMKIMTIGSQYKVWVPPSLGFGEQGRPGVKPNALLIYEIELLAAMEPPAKTGASAAGPGKGPKPAPVSATTPPIAVDIPADGGAPKITPVEPAKPAEGSGK